MLTHASKPDLNNNRFPYGFITRKIRAGEPERGVIEISVTEISTA